MKLRDIVPKSEVVKMYYYENERVWLCLDIFKVSVETL